MIYQIISLLLLAVYWSVYLLKLVHQKKQGIQTDLLGKGKTGFVKGIELSIKAVSFLLITVSLISILLNTHISISWIRICGEIICFIGTLLFCAAVFTMKDSWRAGVPEEKETELVTSGLFAWSRNPAFLGFDLFYAGLTMTFFNWILAVLTLILILLLHLQIVNVEEDFLTASFGKEYVEYRRKTGRYFGRH